mmetsp:Transcript_14309/g.28676  ORF Transcript_14309/g.28676 Transcript_14309/m.28676 type:complete len:380 (+) Transcript_14309:125-1264(+)
MPQVEFYLNSQLPCLHLEESASAGKSVARKSSTRDESMALASHRKRPSDESIGPGDKSPSSVIDKSKTANSTWASHEACRSASGDVNSCPTASRKRIDLKSISSPLEFFTTLLRTRGYPGTTFSSLNGGYRNTPTKHQIASYGVRLTKAIRSSNISEVRLLLQSGLSPNACNKFGESIVHAVCRRGDHKLLRVLIEAGSSIQICDDYGRTPLHDACWTSSPNFETITLLLEQDPWLLCIADSRGASPLNYVRKAHWAVWIGYIDSVSDKYWPVLNDNGDGVVQLDQPVVPPLCCEKPNSRPITHPQDTLSSDVVEMISSGKLDPQDIDKKESTNGEKTDKVKSEDNEPRRRTGISLDPIFLTSFTLGRGPAKVHSPTIS